MFILLEDKSKVMPSEIYNMPLQLLTNEQIRMVVKNKIREEKMLKKISKCKNTMPEYKFYKLAKCYNEAIQFR